MPLQQTDRQHSAEHMAITLGEVIAERTLEPLGSRRQVVARLGRPMPSTRAPWECPYQIIGGDETRVRRALGEDALQSMLLACAGLRQRLQLLKASWLNTGGPGIPPFGGVEFTAHLEAKIDREVAKLVNRLARAHTRNSERKSRMPANQALQRTSRANRRDYSWCGARAARG